MKRPVIVLKTEQIARMEDEAVRLRQMGDDGTNVIDIERLGRLG